VHCVYCSYEIGDKFFLRVKLHKISIKFGKGAKISPRFVGPLEVVENKGHVAYQLDFPNSLRFMHDVSDVFVLRHYISDFSHVIGMSSLKVLDERALMEELIFFQYNRSRHLQCRILNQFKVQWDNYSPHSATWEDAVEMRQQFPYLFDRLDM
jgi:hypothetical protein